MLDVQVGGCTSFRRLGGEIGNFIIELRLKPDRFSKPVRFWDILYKLDIFATLSRNYYFFKKANASFILYLANIHPLRQMSGLDAVLSCIIQCLSMHRPTGEIIQE